MDEQMIFQPVITALKAITGMSDKVYHAEALKNAAAPFIFWLQTLEDEEQALDGYTGLLSASMEIHVVAKNLASLNSISKAARSAVIALQGTTSGGFLFEKVAVQLATPVIDEREVGLFRKVYSVNIQYQIVSIPDTQN